jgi:hypothetical protein
MKEDNLNHDNHSPSLENAVEILSEIKKDLSHKYVTKYQEKCFDKVLDEVVSNQLLIIEYQILLMDLSESLTVTTRLLEKRSKRDEK